MIKKNVLYNTYWGISSAGRTLDLHSRGQRLHPVMLRQTTTAVGKMHKKRREELHLIIESLIAKLRSTEDSVTRKNIYNDIASYAKELTLNISLVQQEMQI